MFNAIERVPQILSGRSLRESEIVAICVSEGAASEEISTQILESLVMLKIIKKVGKGVYSDLNYEAPSVSAVIEHQQNSKTRSEEVLYPENCTTNEKKIEYLLSPNAQIVTRPHNFSYHKSSPVSSGNLLRDAMLASVRFIDTTIVPDSKNKRNVIAFNRETRNGGSFGVQITRNGKFRLAVSGYFGPNAEREEREHLFDSFEAMANFIKGNL